MLSNLEKEKNIRNIFIWIISATSGVELKVKYAKHVARRNGDHILGIPSAFKRRIEIPKTAWIKEIILVHT